jgi:hypothetical protein
MAKKAKGGGGTVKGPTGRTFTKTITQGPNKGDVVTFKVSPSGKPFPVRVLRDKGGDSTLRDNGIPFGKKKKKSS